MCGYQIWDCAELPVINSFYNSWFHLVVYHDVFRQFRYDRGKGNIGRLYKKVIKVNYDYSGNANQSESRILYLITI